MKYSHRTQRTAAKLSLFVLALLSSSLLISASAHCRTFVKRAQTPPAATQPEIIHWTKTYGGFGQDWANAIVPATDGGFFFAGRTESNAEFGMADAWIVKTDASGTVEWQKPFGLRNNEEAFAALASDGGLVFAGETESRGAGGDDAWLVKLDAAGNKLWEKTYGGPGDDRALSLAGTSDGGFIIAGYTDSSGMGGDAWVARLDPQGETVWEKTFGGKSLDSAAAALEVPGGFIVAGTTASFGEGSEDFWLLRLDEAGFVIWEKTYGGPGINRAHALAASASGTFIIAGESMPIESGQPADIFAVKTDGKGNAVWSVKTGGAGDDRAYSAAATPDGGFVIAGDSQMDDLTASDGFVMKLSPTGKQEWFRAFGGSMPDSIRSIATTPDGGFIAAGETLSFGVSDTHAWASKLQQDGTCFLCF